MGLLFCQVQDGTFSSEVRVKHCSLLGKQCLQCPGPSQCGYRDSGTITGHITSTLTCSLQGSQVRESCTQCMK